MCVCVCVCVYVCIHSFVYLVFRGPVAQRADSLGLL